MSDFDDTQLDNKLDAYIKSLNVEADTEAAQPPSLTLLPLSDNEIAELRFSIEYDEDIHAALKYRAIAAAVCDAQLAKDQAVYDLVSKQLELADVQIALADNEIGYLTKDLAAYAPLVTAFKEVLEEAWGLNSMVETEFGVSSDYHPNETEVILAAGRAALAAVGVRWPE